MPKLSKPRQPCPPCPFPGAVYIPLTRGEFAVVDLADAAKVLQFNWCAMRANAGGFYAARWRRDAASRRECLHAFLMGYRDGFELDHRDGDGLNNRRENLRWATYAGNCSNRRKPRSGLGMSSPYKGVCWDRRAQKYKATVTSNGRCFYVGHYPTDEEAARARDALALKLHGEFARLNFPAAKDVAT